MTLSEEVSLEILYRLEFVRTIHFRDCLLIGIAHTIDLEGGLLPTEIVRTDNDDFEDHLFVGIVRAIDLGGCLLIGSVDTI